MGKSINLKASQGSLLLDIDENDWCQVTLSNGTDQCDLGADNIEIIGARLTRALSNGKSNYCGEIDGQPVAWVMSLAEKHFTVYKGAESDTIDFFVQDSDSNLLTKLSLSDEEREDWLGRLASIV